MSTKKKLLQAAAGSAGGEALNVEEVFSTYLYEGNSSTQTITNDIDLSGEGGLAWIKSRTNTAFHHLIDTERGADKILYSNSTAAEFNDSSAVYLTSFNSNGFSLGTGGGTNNSTQDFASWTFRKAPKFFDVVTYTGTGSVQTISHNLGSVPGVVIVKDISGSGNSWTVYHRSAGNTGGLLLNDTNAFIESTTFFNDTTPTDTQFTVGTATNVNQSGRSFVAYLFAHNDGDGDFGPDGDADIIKCGSYTGNGSTDGPEIDLGFEPQWLMIKSSSNADNWNMYDNMRGVTGSSSDPRLVADQTNAEITGFEGPQFNATGFKMVGTAISNGSGRDYIYIAIRRGPMAVPESATDVFHIDESDTSSPPYYRSPFPVDFAIKKVANTTVSWITGTRLLQGKYLITDSTAAEGSSSQWQFDFMNGWRDSSASTAEDYSWMWKRAPNFFDVVAYTGNGTAGRTVSHNLGVAPEMMWVKQRDVSRNWTCYFETLGTGVVIKLNDTTLAQSKTQRFDTAPTDSAFYLGSDTDVNSSSGDYIAYLFASLDGVSKVGSYTGNGTSTGDAQNIDCGFSSGARFVLIKASSVAYGWMLFDTERGITSGNDSLLILNDTDAETTAFDSVDPYSSGFTAVQGPYNVNQNGVEYIFYAIA
jgi:hypothetical protein